MTLGYCDAVIRLNIKTLLLVVDSYVKGGATCAVSMQVEDPSPWDPNKPLYFFYFYLVVVYINLLVILHIALVEMIRMHGVFPLKFLVNKSCKIELW